MLMLDKKFGIEIDKKNRNFVLWNMHTDEKIPEINKNTGKKNKTAGKEVPIEFIGSYREIESLLKMYCYEIIKKSKKKQDSLESIIGAYQDVFKKFKNISYSLVEEMFEMEKEKAS